MIMKKVSLFILSALLILSLTACSGATPTQTTSIGTNATTTAPPQTTPIATKATTTAPPKPVTIRVAWYGNQARHDMMNQMMDNFQKKYPYITVMREFAVTNDYWSKLTTQAAGKSAPDLFVMQYDRFDDYVNRGQLLQLDDLVKSGVIDLSNFYPKHIENGKVNGKTYGVSMGGSIRGLFYNTKMFKDAGVEFPKENWTWDDFVKTCSDLTKNLNQKGVYAIEDFGGSTDSFYTYIKSAGYEFFKGKELGFPKSELKSWLEMMDTLRTQGLIPSPEVQAELGGKGQPDSMFGKGQVAMQMKPTNQLGLYQKVITDELNVFTFPIRKGGVLGDFIGSTNWVIPEYTKSPTEAAMLCNYLVNDTQAIDLWKIELGPLASKKMMDYIYPSLSVADKKLVDYTDKTLPKLLPVVGFPVGSAEVYSGFASMYEKVAFKKLTIDQAINEYFAEATKILTQQ